MKTKPPYFITIEGTEGVGKTTCLTFIEAYLKQQNIPYRLTREPGGTPVAEKIRNILLEKSGDEIIAEDTELLLMFASRAQHIAQVIKPALNAKQWVISDRFTDASYAYQGGGRGISLDRIAKLENWVHGDLQADLTLLLDAPVALALERAKQRSTPDRIESEKIEFFERVRQTYLQRAKEFPARFKIIDASQTEEKVQQAVNTILEGFE